MKTAVIVTTKDRPHALQASLPQIALAAAKVQAPVLVVDDGSTCCETDLAHGCFDLQEICQDVGALYFQVPVNRGLAGALNIGLSYWLADPSIKAIHYFQDDVEVDPLAIKACNVALTFWPHSCVTGHDAKEHREQADAEIRPPWCPDPQGGIKLRARASCRATHMSAEVASWRSVMPIRSKGLGLPKRVPRAPDDKEQRGEGSGVDWWIVRDCIDAGQTPLQVICIPGLVRTFAFKAVDSCWGNPQIAGEDAPLSRAAIAEWKGLA